MTNSSLNLSFGRHELGRVAYAPTDESLTSPGDARRFPAYARARGIDFEFARKGEAYDMVVVTEMADLPYWTRQVGPRIIFDIPNAQLNDDRHLLNLGRGPAKSVFGQASGFHLSWRKVLKKMILRSDAVVCCSPEQAQALLLTNDNVHTILDGHFGIPLTNRQSEDCLSPRPTVVWEGLPGSLTAFEEIAESLQYVSQKTGAEFRFVTDRKGIRYLNKIGSYDVEKRISKSVACATLIPWSPVNLASELSRANVGIIPVDMRRGICIAKPENRLLLMWRAGLPVVASATPAHVRTMQAAGVHDYCRTDRDWSERLVRLLSDPRAAEENAELGGRFVAREHSQEQWLSRWDAVMESIPF